MIIKVTSDCNYLLNYIISVMNINRSNEYSSNLAVNSFKFQFMTPKSIS